jgi:LysM domain-containing protein
VTVGDPLPIRLGARRGAARSIPVTVRDVCPYLEADGGWRSTSPNHQLRCQAVRPAIRLGTDQQRRLCLTAGHADCSTFLAARATQPVQAHPSQPVQADLSQRASPVQLAANDAPGLWHFTRAAPALIDDGRLGLPIAIGGRERTVSQASLGAALVAVLALLVVVRLSDRPAEPTADVAAVPSLVVATPVASRPAPTPPPSPAPTPATSPVVGGGEVSPAPSPTGAVAGATATPRPRRYRVQPGDTLVSIAQRFGATVKAIQTLNGIDDPTRLRVGQILRIP